MGRTTNQKRGNNMAHVIQIPRYQCHKQVQALKIKLAIMNPRGVELHFEDERFCPIQMPLEFARKHTDGQGTQALAGGYVVWYEDGYASWSPAEAFEQGYSLIEAGPKDTGTSKAAKKLAAQLNGSEYPLRISNELAEKAKAAGLVIVYGASDDLMEFAGAIYDELGVNDGGTALVDAEGLLPENADNLDTDEERARYYYRKGKAKTIEALWAKEGDYSWTYRTAIPHETFEVVEDGGPYCRGIVFALADVGV